MVWTLTVVAACRVDRLQQHDERLLAELETVIGGGTYAVLSLIDSTSAAGRELFKLGVIEAWSRLPEPYESGGVRLISEGVEGPAVTDWETVQTWLTDYLASSRMADVRRKLDQTGADERHAFIGISYTTPGEVFFALDQGKGLPLDPKLPREISHVWLMRPASPGGRCLHGDPNKGWQDVQRNWRTA